MTNRQWLEKLNIPLDMVRCDQQNESECHIMLRIAYDEQPWQTRKSIMIAKAPYIRSEVESLSQWYAAEYKQNDIIISDESIKIWLEN